MAGTRQFMLLERRELSRRLARRGRLRYVSDQSSGIERRRRGRGFAYFDAQGRRITDRRVQQRIADLAIPPAWTDVWICASENGHLQATGRDERGRKQYLYHERWREVADQLKFDRLVHVGQALPRIRKRITADLKMRRLTRDSVIAAMVRLLDATGIRVGNEEYRRDNGSYGLTTLSRRHIKIVGSRLYLDFRGKGGVRHQLEVVDPQVARIIRQCLKSPGSSVFQFPVETGWQAVTAEDVNSYLSEATVGTLTAKDFRTWQASVCVAAELATSECPGSARGTKRLCNTAIGKAAALLGNTVTVCRKYYVHTGLVDAYCSGEYPKLVADFAPRRRKWYQREEQLLLHVLRNVAG
jgi:DNA topoisomerase-1